MKVRNRKPIRKLSVRSLKTSGKRNAIAVVAIALTTILFTTLFTIAISLNTSYEEYTFRQIGGYSHGAFKEVSERQIKEISQHPDIKEAGRRTTVGTITEGVFSKVPAELSYMDENCTKWSYIDFKKGRAPEKKNEVAMDMRALELLGIEPKIGAKIDLTYDFSDKSQSMGKRTDTFTLSGWWEFDDLCPVHFINVSNAYVDMVQHQAIAKGAETFRTDLNVMLSSSLNIQGTLDEVIDDLGYQKENPQDENYIRTGVNWGYTAAQTDSIMSVETIIAIAALLILIIFTGYLIIYNIFQISVTGDIRYYGLLKTIGVTGRQLRRIIRYQALALCVIGCPIGLILGYLAGYILTPVILANFTLGMDTADISASPLIFIGAALFSIVTVLLSCMKPGRIASKVSPVEATKYTEASKFSAKKKATRGAKIHMMAFANLGRNKLKTVLVVVSLSLSVVLLSILYAFTGGFSMEKYLDSKTCADFIVGKTDYFRFDAKSADSAMPEETLDLIKSATKESVGGQIWGIDGEDTIGWLTKEQIKENTAVPDEMLKEHLSALERRGNLYGGRMQTEAIDSSILQKLKVFKGDIAPLKDPDEKAVAIEVPVDDYGKPKDIKNFPRIGDKITLTYVEEGYYIDSRTGKKSSEDTPEKYIKYHVEKSYDKEYTVCALVSIPYQMSFRYQSGDGYTVVMETEQLKTDCKTEIFPLMYLFDTSDAKSETEAESVLAEMTKSDTSEIMYESKQTVRDEFDGFKQMFMILGGVLCGIIGLVGILNFFNGVMTGILSRRREFAMLQSIGMTGKQLKTMLVFEGLFYAMATVILSTLLTVILGPLVGGVLESMFWFYDYKFTMTAIFITAPVFLALGILLPMLVYRSVAKKTIVERLRESE